MIRKRQNAVCAALLLALASAPLGAASFVYEGQLDDRGVPANGRYDLQLAVYQDAELGATLAEPMVFAAVEVVDGDGDGVHQLARFACRSRSMASPKLRKR